MAKDINNKCNFNHSVNVILFFMFFVVLIAVSFNGCFNACEKTEKEQIEKTNNEVHVNDTVLQDSLTTN